MWQFLNKFRKKEHPEAVSQYSLMKNRSHTIPMEVFTTLDHSRKILNESILLKERQDADLNFINHIRTAEELKTDPRFVTTFN